MNGGQLQIEKVLLKSTFCCAFSIHPKKQNFRLSYLRNDPNRSTYITKKIEARILRNNFFAILI